MLEEAQWPAGEEEVQGLKKEAEEQEQGGAGQEQEQGGVGQGAGAEHRVQGPGGHWPLASLVIRLVWPQLHARPAREDRRSRRRGTENFKLSDILRSSKPHTTPTKST